MIIGFDVVEDAIVYVLVEGSRDELPIFSQTELQAWFELVLHLNFLVVASKDWLVVAIDRAFEEGLLGGEIVEVVEVAIEGGLWEAEVAVDVGLVTAHHEALVVVD